MDHQPVSPEWVIFRTMKARKPSFCGLRPEHKIRKGQIIGLARPSSKDNTRAWVCPACVAWLTEAEALWLTWPDGLVVTERVYATFPGRCKLHSHHTIDVGHEIAKIGKGWVCHRCLALCPPELRVVTPEMDIERVEPRSFSPAEQSELDKLFEG